MAVCIVFSRGTILVSLLTLTVLDRTAVTYSYKHSCMVSLAVRDVPNQDEWHLPTFDPHNQNIYHYKLHSVDIYFWTPLDALHFVNGVRRVLPAAQLDIQDEPAVPAPPPPPPPQQVHNGAGMSSVVQKLESVALTGGSSAAAGAGGAAPPLSAVSADAGHAPAPAFAAPIAYNPAAPAAPEAIRPREKTPPPEDAAGGHNPLHQTLYQDAATPFSPGLVVPAGLGPLSPGIPPPSMQVPPGAPSFPAPPAYSSQPPTPAGPPQSQHYHPSGGITRAATMPVTSPSPFNPAASFPAFSPPPAQASQPAPPSASAPPSAPAAAAPPPAPTAGYSHFSYANARVPGAGGADFSVHQQLYRPTQGESAVTYSPKQDPRGKLEETAGRLERGVTGIMKKIEKRLG